MKEKYTITMTKQDWQLLLDALVTANIEAVEFVENKALGQKIYNLGLYIDTELRRQGFEGL